MSEGDTGVEVEVEVESGVGVGAEVRADSLRRELVDSLCASRVVVSSTVEAALRAVPRHLFLPGVPLPQAYADDAVVTRRDAAGMPSSSASQPAVVAVMLEQLGLSAGMRVLEIGAGTGYNAALMAAIVGPEGAVTTVDLDAEVAAGARANLDGAGFPGVRVECGDGGLGYAPGAPYDRVIVTVGAWDLPPAWFTQLDVSGRLVVPLGLRGPQRCICFVKDRNASEADARQDAVRGAGRDVVRDAARDVVRDAGRDVLRDASRDVVRDAAVAGIWRSRSVAACGFMAMRGDFSGPARQVTLGDDTALWVDDGRPVDVDAVRRSMAEPVRDEETGLRITTREAWNSLSLWLALNDRDHVRLHMSDSMGAGALLERDSLAVPIRSTAAAPGGDGGSGASAEVEGGSEPEQFELAVRAFGPRGTALAQRLADRIADWHRAGRPPTELLQVDVHPKSTPDELVDADYIIDKTHIRLGVSFSQT
jgi:protein-L-isoaspartate(D-aspartate) O-methyltransferase